MVASPKIEFIGVTEDHEVPNPRYACEPGILVAAVANGAIRAVLAAASGKVEDLHITNPIGFGCTKQRGRFGFSTKTWHYNGRSLRALPKSDFTLVVDKQRGDAQMPGTTIEARPSQSKLKKAAKAATLIGVAAVVVTAVISSDKGKQLANKASDSLRGLRNR